MRPLLKLRSVRILLILLAAIGAYAAAGFWLVPRVLRSQIVVRSRTMLGLAASVGEIRFNPFLLQLRVDDLAVADRSGSPMAGFKRLFVDFEVSSLWRRAYVFREIEIDSPFTNAVISAGGAWNLAQFVPRSSAPKPAPAANAPLPRIRVDALRIAGARFDYLDHRPPADLTLRLAPIDLDLRDFATDAAGGQFVLSASTPLGERIDWHGRVAVAPFASDGEIRISGLRARTVSTILRNRLGARIGFALTSGRIGLVAHYRAQLQPTLRLAIDQASAEIAELGVAPAGSTEDWIRLPRLQVGAASFDLKSRRVQVGQVALRGLSVDAWLDAAHRLNLAALAGQGASTSSAAATSASSPATVASTSASASSSASASAGMRASGAPPARPWQATLGRFSLADARVSFEDRSTHPGAKFLLAPLSLEVDGASLDTRRPVTVRLASGVGAQGRIAANGTVVPAPLSANLSIAAHDVDLAALQPYIAQATSLTLDRGRLHAALRLQYHTGGPALLLTGALGVDDLHTIDDALQKDLVNWRQVDLRGLRLQLDPDRIAIAQVLAVRPYARVIIEPDRSLNVKRILSAPGAATASAAPAGPLTGTAVADRTRPARQPAPAGSRPKEARQPMRVTIGTVEIQDGQTDFADLSITPNFSSGIDHLSGLITDLDSKPGARAKVNLHGQVGPYSPVAISGALNLFGPETYTDLSLSFRNMDLTIFNPYSGKFAGYEITKGKLTTEMHYLVDHGRLNASHHVTIDQLEFGAKTASKDAISLPVKLAVALLKDRNGVIDLNLPVTGSLADPEFRLAPLIWKVVVNVLTKAVAAPFKLLGALFGAGPQIQFADFRPGDAALDATDLAHLQVVAKALAARPQLKVDVPIAPLAALDAPALVEARYRAQIDEQMLGRPTLDPKAQVAMLATLYRAQFGSRPRYPAPPKGQAATPEAQIAFLATALKSRIHIGPADLRALAERRAVAMEQALVTGTGVDPSRVFLVANDKVTAHAGAVRLQLVLR